MPTSAHQFLRWVLPEEGLKCAVVITDRRPIQKFFTSTDELAAYVLTQDGLGHTVYHACASFKTGENRKAINALGARALWLDVDAGEGKPYADASEAAEAVSAFCRATRLPPPVYVGSGVGVHCYWPLVEILDPVRWKAFAAGLKHLCLRHGLEAGPERTADLASILRTPGTHHRKDVPRVVRCGPLVGPYTLEELGGLNDADVQNLPVLRVANERKTPAKLPADSIGAVLLSTIFPDVPANPHAIADSCRQIGDMRGRAGNIPEPTWYAAIGVLGYAEGGERVVHEWSSGYPGYTHVETQARLERQKAFGPTTCAHFQSINPKGCEGCPHAGKITTPLQLGRGKDVRSEDAKRFVENVPSWIEQPKKDQRADGLPPLPKEFHWEGGGLVWKKENNEGADDYSTLSAVPLFVDSIQTGEITSDNFSICFKLRLPRSPERQITIPAKNFFSNTGLSELAGRGAVIHDQDMFRKYVREAIDMWHEANDLNTRYDQFGWKEDEQSFLFGRDLYTAGAVRQIIGSEEIKLRSQYLGPNKGGSLGRWSRAANTLFTKGCEPQSFALLASFAAPLMRFHTAGEGGAIVSLVSDQSGSGKTTALEAVASVWGRLKGIQLTDDDTKVSKGLTLGVLGNLPCTYDELYNRDPELIRQFVLMFTNGRDKMRGTVDGTLRHSKAEWQTILVLASNNSIVDVLSSMDGTDAPAFRLLEFVCEIPKTVEKKGDELKRELAANSGFAGDAFLRALIQPDILGFIKQSLPKWTDELWTRTKLKSEHRFWIRTLASVIAAGTVVRHAGIMDFSVQRLTDWCIEQFQARAPRATVTGTRNAQDTLAEFLAAHVSDMLVVPTEWKPKVTMHPLLAPRRTLVVRYELDSGSILILESELRKWLVKMGVNRQAFYDTLQMMGIGGTIRRATLGAGTDYASGQATVVAVNGQHPAMSGVAVNVEKLIPKGPINTRAERLRMWGNEGA